ncbi:hypothetical protein [Cryptosporangium phraense]|uniref:Uncharacterized protein n=1 Tax=Cryptosporangium phraense TaxID=2593070 RepID=A0A545ARD5_9ACTN|nr:hypothetical protein [Cryptosporangium phraense]TQS43811.1 hypothetical protein FL583_17455 [Cryptosporangium phraense]
MADRDGNIRASLNAIHEFGAQVKDIGTKDLANGLGGNFAVEMSQGALAFSDRGEGGWTGTVPPLGEAIYFGSLMSNYSQAAGRFASEAILGLTSLGYAAQGIALQYRDGDALSGVTMDNVVDAFIPRPGDQQPGNPETTQAAATDEKRGPGGQPGDPDAPVPTGTGERPAHPGGGPGIPDADSDDYQTPALQI